MCYTGYTDNNFVAIKQYNISNNIKYQTISHKLSQKGELILCDKFTNWYFTCLLHQWTHNSVPKLWIDDTNDGIGFQTDLAEE